MRVLLLISLLYRLALSQVPTAQDIKAKCIFPFGTIELKDTYEANLAPATGGKRVLSVTGSLSNLCPSSSYTLSFGQNNNPGYRCQNGVLQPQIVGNVQTNEL